MIVLTTYLVLILVLNGDATEVFTTDPSIVKIGARLYKKELLTDQLQAPKELVYDSSSRNLFFTYMDDEIQNSGRALINVFTKEVIKIKGIEKNKAIAINEETSEVYFGSEDGLYKYDPLDHTASNIGLYNVNIMKIVIRNNNMYVLDANTHKIYEATLIRRYSKAKNVIEFVIDNDGNLHFMSICGLYCISATTPDIIVKNRDVSTVYNFIVDGNNTFGLTEDGIYDLHCKNGTARRLGDLNFEPRSITFGDYGDIYYSDSDDDSIYRLRPISTYVVYNIYNAKRKDRGVAMSNN